MNQADQRLLKIFFFSLNQLDHQPLCSPGSSEGKHVSVDSQGVHTRGCESTGCAGDPGPGCASSGVTLHDLQMPPWVAPGAWALSLLSGIASPPLVAPHPC